MKKLLLLIGLIVFSLSAKSEEYFCESKNSGNVYIAPYGCFNNITLTKEEFLSKSDKLITYNPNTIFYCEKKGGWEIYITSTSCDSSSLSITKEEFTKKTNTNYTKGMESFNNAPRKNFCEEFSKSWICTSVNQGQMIEKRTASFDELSIALGCGIKKNDIDDCVKRYLAFFLGTGPMTMEEVDEIKKDKLVMGEIVKAIEEMHIANNQSQQEPTEEEKAFAQAQEQGLINNQNFYKMYDPILEKHLNSRGWTQVNPKLEKILNSIGKSQVPVKHQKRFTIRAGNLNYNF